ncbi:hypothetical protein OQA88_6223 [Cercophora sp. LCS_1]
MAAAQGGEDVYASVSQHFTYFVIVVESRPVASAIALLLTDTYLPGALVLAHSLRDAGTKKKLAILVTLDTVSAEVITQLKVVYDYVIPVPRIRNERPANLFLMNRPDLHSAFTKINLWRQTQFKKIVYLDADVVAYRAPDELFDLPHAFSAAPDIGWPDLFNTGVMVLTPNMGDYYAMMAMAQRGISFDGADQGLLNMHFKNTYNRLSFTYNVTPSAHYQYVPAYKHFQSSINLVHFIGSEKPWLQGRDKSTGDTPFDEIAGRWWAVYDRHYRIQSPTLQVKQVAVPKSTEVSPGPIPPVPAPEIVRYFVKGEYQPTISYVVPVGPPPNGQPGASYVITNIIRIPMANIMRQPLGLTMNTMTSTMIPTTIKNPSLKIISSILSTRLPSPAWLFNPRKGRRLRLEQSRPQSTNNRLPNQHHLSRSLSLSRTNHRQLKVGMLKDSQPEALNFPQTHYEMSSDPAPFVPPERYPSPPKGMWYEVPKERPAPAHEKPKPIFPWETHQPRPTRVFHQDAPGSPEAETPAASFGERKGSTESQHQAEPSMTGSPTVEPRSEPQTPPTPTVRIVPSNPWSSFPRSNAWDEVPEINRYVDSIQKHSRTRSQGLGKTPPRLILRESSSSWGSVGTKVTDFPSEDDRPSLPVTPAPIRRPRFWGGGAPGIGLEGEEDDERLPAAEGVPGQLDWDPVSQLQKLAQQQSDALRRLSTSGATGEEIIGTEGRELPSRPLPYGSEELKSPTYVAYSPPEVVSPKPMKPSHGASPVQKILNTDLDDVSRQISMQSLGAIGDSGVAKGESIPISEA